MRITDIPPGRDQQAIPPGSARRPERAIHGSRDDTISKNSAHALKKPGTLRRKKLNYNSREIRSSLVRAVRSQTAGLVLNTAKSKLVSLLKCKGCGMYNENELNAAIGHARRMVRCAKLKLRNLTMEEQQQLRNEKAAERESGDPGMEELQKAMRIKQRKLALEQKRRIHRNLEYARMNQADEEFRSRQAREQRDEKATSADVMDPAEPSLDPVFSAAPISGSGIDISGSGADTALAGAAGGSIDIGL